MGPAKGEGRRTWWRGGGGLPQGAPRRSLPVRIHILLVVLVAVLPVVLLAAFLANGYVRAETERLERRVRDAVLDATLLIERDLAGVTATLQALATSRALREGDLPAFRDQAMEVKALTGLDLFLRDSESRPVLNTEVPPGAPLPAGSALAEWDAEVRATGRPVISGHFLRPPSGEHRFAVIVPVFRDRAIVYFLHTSLPASRLRDDLLAQMGLPKGWAIGIVDRGGTVLAHIPGGDATVGTPAPNRELLQTAAAEDDGAAHYATDRDGHAVLVAVHRSPVSGWFLVGTASVEELLAPLHRTLRLVGAAGAVLIALALAGAWLLGDRLARAIRGLAALGATVEAGASVQALRTAIREVNEVSETLANASAALAAREAERRQAAERQQLILRELNHRVRNTLATVDSIVRLTARYVSDVAEYETRLTDRIRSLAKTHELLTGADWTQAALTQLLRNELAAYALDDGAAGDAGGGQCRFDGPPVTLSARQAVAFGMLVHELATNAAKYGALSVPEGRVEVRWTVREESGEANGGIRQRLDFFWHESGGPPVRPPTRRGFGTQMIQRAIARDLAAELETDYAPAGLRFRLSMPLSDPHGSNGPPPGHAVKETPAFLDTRR